MKKSKKLLLVFLAIVSLFALTGCQNQKLDRIKNATNNFIEEIESVATRNPEVTMKVEYVDENGETKEGTVKMELYPEKAPVTVANFVNLTNNGFYNNLTFHRIIKDFMIQGGDQEGNGSGYAKRSDIDKSIEKDSSEDYGYSIKGEFKDNNIENDITFEKGIVAIARSDYSTYGMAEEGYNSGCSQFFIMNTDDEQTNKYLQGKYAAFGKVIEGYDVIEALSNLEVQENEYTGEKSIPVKVPIIKSMEVNTFGKKYDIPELINADETLKKVQQKYLQMLQQYYSSTGANEDNHEDTEVGE